MLQLLETFCAVAEVGSLTRAAERLHTTQPAITRQMRSLERELGTTLLARTPQGVTLTAAGRAVLAPAKEAIAAVRAARAAAAEASSGGAGRLRIAAGLMATQYVLPEAVAAFQARYPEVRVELQPVHQRVAVERLLGSEVEAAVIASPVRSPLMKATTVMRDPLLVVWAPVKTGQKELPDNAGLDEGGSGEGEGLRLEALRGRTVLALAAGTGLHELVEEALRKRKVFCQLKEYPTAETIKTAVRLGMGVTILPASAVREERRGGTLRGRVIADWPGGERAIRVLTRSSGRANPVVGAFVAVLREVCNALDAG